MGSHSRMNMEGEQMQLPAGFRFHPTDEELITCYLSKKVINIDFDPIAVSEADFNKVEPWDLPGKAKMGENEWYFFCMRDRKYPTGLRTNRATQMGYWKATGKDKEIYRAKVLIGMKKTLVFYTGRAPKGEKTNWVMHEYRLEGKSSKHNHAKEAKNEWVLSRVFYKKSSSGDKRANFSGLMNIEELHPSSLPPLMDSSPYNNSEAKAAMIVNPSHVTCFSSQHLVVEDQKGSTVTTQDQDHHIGMIGSNINDVTTTPSSSSPFSQFSLQNMLMEENMADLKYPDSFFMHDQSILRLLNEGKGSDMTMTGSSTAEFSQETGLSVGDINNNMSPISTNDQMAQNPTGPIDLDCLWDY